MKRLNTFLLLELSGIPQNSRLHWNDDNPENCLKNSICRIYEIVTYYSRLVRTSLCKTRIDFDHKKSQITGVYEVNYRVGNDEAILREYYFNKVSILN